jgi:hypothetical protein
MPDQPKIPISLKLAYTAFVAVLVPYYWITYGPTNFLYFCDVALLLTLVAVWKESALPASVAAVGIIVPQIFWQVDFLGTLLGVPQLGMTAYMFDPGIPLFARSLSFFHFWLPLLLVWLVWRLGYDRRALLVWTVAAWGLMLICYFALPAPPAPAGDPNLPVNVNYVYGMDDAAPQQWLPPLAYLALLMVALPLLAYVPTHLALARWFARTAPQQSTAIGIESA